MIAIVCALTLASIALLYATAFVDPGFVPRDPEDEAGEEGYRPPHPDPFFQEHAPCLCLCTVDTWRGAGAAVRKRVEVTGVDKPLRDQSGGGSLGFRRQGDVDSLRHHDCRALPLPHIQQELKGISMGSRFSQVALCKVGRL